MKKPFEVRRVETGSYAGVENRMLIGAAQSAPVAVVEMVLPGGARIGPERHPEAETVVPFGPLTLVAGGKAQLLHLGDAVDIAGHVEHELLNAGADPVRILSIATPAWGASG